MKERFLSAVAVLSIISLAVASAEPTMKVHLMKPPPGRYGIEDMWKATVTSDTVCDARFEGWVFETSRGQVFHATTKPFRLTLGTKVYQYRDVTIDETQTAPGYEMFVTRSGSMPNGKYRFKLILTPFGVGDSNEFDVKPMGPPRLIIPRDLDTAKAKYPVFNWTPPSPMLREPVTYELRIWEVLAEQTPEEAAAANKPWFEQAGIRATSLNYPISARPMGPGAEPADSGVTGTIKGIVTDKVFLPAPSGEPADSIGWEELDTLPFEEGGRIRGRVLDKQTGEWLVSEPVASGNTGSILGKVTDRKTGEPLCGASIGVVGTEFGAATDVNGACLIINVPPGKYTLAASRPGSRAESASINIVKDSAATADFRLSAGLPATARYGWQVTAVTSDGVRAASEVRSFHAAAVAVPPPPPPPAVTVAATIVWEHWEPSTGSDIWLANMDGDQNVTPAVPLCNLAGRDYDPAIAFDRSGNATVVWAHQGTGANDRFGIYYSRRTGTTWSQPAVLCPGTKSPIYHNFDPVVAFDETGKGLCVWVRAGEPVGDRNELYYSVWNGSSWSDSAAVYRLPPGADPFDTTFRYPEITFTKSGQAVVVALAGANPFDPNSKPSLVYIPWSGSAWSAPTSLTGLEGAHQLPYSMPDLPARLRNSIAADCQEDRVHVRWSGRDGWTWGSSGTCSGGTWAWTTPVHASVTTNQGRGAVVTSDGAKLKTIGDSGGHIVDETGPLPPGYNGPAGKRPSAAWLCGSSVGVVAAWQHPLSSGNISWAFWNSTSGSWLWPKSIPSTGGPSVNRNPDIATRSGSHTMPVKP